MLGLFFSEHMMPQCLRSVEVLMWLQEAIWGSFPIAHISEERIIVIIGEANAIVQFRTKLWVVLAGTATSILYTCWRYISKHWSEITCLKIIFKGYTAYYQRKVFTLEISSSFTFLPALQEVPALTVSRWLYYDLRRLACVYAVDLSLTSNIVPGTKTMLKQMCGKMNERKASKILKFLKTRRTDVVEGPH